MTNDEIATKLEHCLVKLEQYIRTLRGEEQDLTGLGLWRIFCNNLEVVMDVKVITKDQWNAFCDLQSNR